MAAPGTNVYIANMPLNVDDNTLRAMFEPFGPIISAKVMLDLATNISRGFGFVQFASPASAAAAINNANGGEYEGKKLLVKIANNDAAASKPTTQVVMSTVAYAPGAAQQNGVASDNVYVAGLPLDWSLDYVNTFFGNYGTIVSSMLIKDKATGLSKGGALVRYSDAASAATAIQTLNGYQIEGTLKPLVVKLAENKGTTPATAAPATPSPLFRYTPATQVVPTLSASPSTANDNVYVAGLPVEWTVDDVNQFFQAYGAISSSTLIKDKVTQAPKGGALVRFVDPSAAANAIANLAGVQLEGASRPLIVKLADNKNVTSVAPTLSTPLLRYAPYPQVQTQVVPAAASRLVPGTYTFPTPPTPAQSLSGASFQPGLAAPVIPKTTLLPEENANLYIYGIDPNVCEVHLYEAFSPFGAISSVKVVVDPSTKQSKGYAFVQFLHSVEAANAVEKMNGVNIGSRAWAVSFHVKKQ